MAQEFRIGPQQQGGTQHQVLFGVTTYKFGQQGGSNTVDPAMDALETFLQTQIGAVGLGFPNGPSGDPTGILNAAGSARKRFAVFAVPMIPYANAGNGSLDRFINSSTYDAAHHLNAQKLVAARPGPDHACRFSHEFNTQVGQQGNYPWSTGFHDTFTGNPITIAQYHAAAEKIETIYRSEGWTGYAAWSGGTSNTSALPIETAIPTHGDPALTVWDYDSYLGTRYNTTKNDYASGWPLVRDAWDRYASYCHTNGIMMASSEFDAHIKVASPYVMNDAAGAQFFFDTYALWKKYAYLMAWALLYVVNQPSGGINDEEHDMFLSVSSPGGSPSGTGPTAEYTGNFPPGKTSLIDVANGQVNGTQNLAQMGNLDNSSATGLNWIWSPSKNRLHGADALKKTYGGFGTTGGAAGLVVPVTPPVIPTGPATSVLSGKRRTTRQQYTVYA